MSSTTKPPVAMGLWGVSANSRTRLCVFAMRWKPALAASRFRWKILTAIRSSYSSRPEDRRYSVFKPKTSQYAQSAVVTIAIERGNQKAINARRE